MPVVALVSDLPNTGRDHFIGIDNRAAGRTAGVLMGRFLGGGPGQVLVLGQSLLARDMIERRRGFDEVMLRDFPDLEVLPSLETHGSADRCGRSWPRCWPMRPASGASMPWGTATAP